MKSGTQAQAQKARATSCGGRGQPEGKLEVSRKYSYLPPSKPSCCNWSLRNTAPILAAYVQGGKRRGEVCKSGRRSSVCHYCWIHPLLPPPCSQIPTSSLATSHTISESYAKLRSIGLDAERLGALGYFPAFSAI